MKKMIKKRNRIEILVKAKSFFREAINANEVKIRVPVPSDVFNPQFKCSISTGGLHLPDMFP